MEVSIPGIIGCAVLVLAPCFTLWVYAVYLLPDGIAAMRSAAARRKVLRARR